jgi:hypothetical protein
MGCCRVAAALSVGSGAADSGAGEFGRRGAAGFAEGSISCLDRLRLMGSITCGSR